MTGPMLELDRVSMHFPVKSERLFGGTMGTVKAVDDVSFQMQPGETLALVGESGCGKTTTARLILELLEPTAGRVLVDGTDIATLKGKALRRFRTKLQAVCQDPWASLNPRMAVRDIIAEPVSALDVSIRSQIMNLFKDLQAQFDVGYVLVAHDLGTTRYMADWIAVMYLGRVVELAPSETLFEAPKHPYTEALLSAALPSHPGADHRAIVLAGEVPSPIDPPAGCGFNPRCHRKVGAVCEPTMPPFRPLTDRSHRVACHIYTDEQERERAA